MVWTDNDVTNLILVAKDVGIHLTESIVRKLTLGKSIDRDIDYLYLLSNIVFSLENSSDDNYEDTDYDLMAEMVNRIEVQRNRFRAL